MIATFFVAAFFVLAGLSVVAIALSGGRKAKATRGGGARGQTRAVAIGVTAVVIGTGIAIPAVILASNNSAAAKQGPGGVELTSAQADGRKLFAKRCSTCHALGGANAVGRVGPNLDELRPPKALTLDAITMGRARGNGQMPRGLFEGEDAENVASFIERVAGR